MARRLAALGRGQDPRVLLEIAIALGRLRWSEAPRWIAGSLTRLDRDLAHAAMQAMRRSRNWSDVLGLLDAPPASPLHALALRAIEGASDPVLAAGLIERLRKEIDPARRLEYAEALTRIQKRPGPWVYWGFRPGPRPPNTVVWEKSDAIAAALDGALADPDRAVRAAVLKGMRREKIPAQAASLARWLREERDRERVASILESLGESPGDEGLEAAADVAAETVHDAANRIAAVSLIARAAPGGRLLRLAESLESSAVLAEAMRGLARARERGGTALLRRGIESPIAEVRAAAAECLAELEVRESGYEVARLLEDADVRVRRAAAAALVKLETREATAALLNSAVDADPEVRRNSLDALRVLNEPHAAPIAAAALRDHETEVAAIRCLADVGGPEHAQAVADLAANSRSIDVLGASVRALDGWSSRAPGSRAALDEAVARMQGASGVILRWTAGVASPQASLDTIQRIGAPGATIPAGWRTLIASGPESSVTLPPPRATGHGEVALACADVLADEAVPVQLLASSNGALRVWINGRQAYRRDQPAAFRSDADRFDADLAAGANRIVAQVAGAANPQLHLRFRRRSSTVEHERLTQLVLATAGDADRGRGVLANVQKSACLKCHRLGSEGGSIAPELTGIGRRFSRIHIIEAILEPSRTIADSFQAHAVRLKDGRFLTGVKAAESDTTITIGDQDGKVQPIAKSEVESDEPLAVSIMPEGLEKAMTDQELIDLIAFLEAQR